MIRTHRRRALDSCFYLEAQIICINVPNFLCEMQALIIQYVVTDCCSWCGKKSKHFVKKNKKNKISNCEYLSVSLRKLLTYSSLLVVLLGHHVNFPEQMFPFFAAFAQETPIQPQPW